jgi:LmbE family N-acetylglucosaminyl deacetylase
VTPESALIPYETSRFGAKTALVLAPHADDEVFGCGAAIADLNAAGARVVVQVLTDGAGDVADPGERARIGERRVAESRAALEILGGGSVRGGDLPDRSLGEHVPRLEGFLTRLVAEVRPDLVFVPSPSEVHPDHRAAAQAFLSLVRRRPAGDAAADILRDARIAFYEVSQPIRPNFLLDATAHMAAKDLAVAAFVSQLGGHDYPSYVRGLNAYRTMTLPRHVAFAEAFYVIDASRLRSCTPGSLSRAIGPGDTAELESPRSPRRGLWSRIQDFVTSRGSP